jgi:fibronectin type 3 domain-containing protein
MRLDFRKSSSLLSVALLFFAMAALVLTACGKNRAASQARVGPHSVTLSWSASTSPVDGYYVYRRSAPGANYVRLNSEPLKATQYTDTTVESSHSYTYYVTAVDSRKIESTASTMVSATVPAP